LSDTSDTSGALIVASGPPGQTRLRVIGVADEQEDAPGFPSPVVRFVTDRMIRSTSDHEHPVLEVSDAARTGTTFRHRRASGRRVTADLATCADTGAHRPQKAALGVIVPSLTRSGRACRQLEARPRPTPDALAAPRSDPAHAHDGHVFIDEQEVAPP
jgi:hypothetical protein